MRRLFMTLALASSACTPNVDVAREPDVSLASVSFGATPAPAGSSAAGPESAGTSVAAPPSASVGTSSARNGRVLLLAPLPGYQVKVVSVSAPCSSTSESDAALEKHVEQGSACAAAALGERIVGRRGLPADYARAMSLLTAALDAGVAVSCWPFGASADRARYAQCLQLGNDRAAFALAVAYGDGVRRDLRRARALAKELGDESCDASMLTEQLDESARQPGGWSPQFCSVAACTTMTMNRCVGVLDEIDGFETSAERGRLVALMSAAELSRYAQVKSALEAYRKTDSDRVYLLHIAGTMRNLMASGRGSVLDHELDAMVAKIVDRAPLPTATDQDLAGLSKKIADAEQQAARDGTPDLGLHPGAQRDYQKALTASTPAYARYERAMIDLAKDRLDAAGIRALRAELRRARLEALADD